MVLQLLLHHSRGCAVCEQGAFQRICKKAYIREVIGGDLVAYFKKMRDQANLDAKHPEYTEKLASAT